MLHRCGYNLQYNVRRQCQIANMADAALARREARRRKILENSQNRLQRISGKAGDDSCTESPVYASTPDYEDINTYENSTEPQLSNGSITALQSNECLFSNNISSQVITRQEEVINDLASLLPPGFTNASLETPPAQKQSLFEKLTSYKYDIVLLSLFVQILYNFSTITVESTYLFLPLITYAGTKVYWCPKQGNSKFENVLILLKGLSTNRLHKILSVTQFITAIGLDACIFVFTTICVQALCIFMKQLLIT